MAVGKDEAGDRTCPRCGSAAVTRQRVIEHEPCGAIKPEPVFCTADGIVCPDCGERCREVAFIDGDRPWTCGDCGHTFGTSRAETADGETAWQRDATVVLERARSRIAATPSPVNGAGRGRRMLVVVVAVLLVSAAAIAAIGPATFRPEPVATETVPASNPVADGSETDDAVEDGERGRSEETAWQSYRSIVIFRNDDVQTGYRADAMHAVDRVFIEENVPVTQGVIPPLEDDRSSRELCSYLREQADAHPETFEYALHGYTHDRRTGFHGGSEFGGLPPERQQELLQEGTAALESCVGQPPTTFVPPFNTYDEATASTLAEHGYAAVSGGEWFTRAYFNETGPFAANGILHLPNTHSFVRNWTTNEFYSQRTLERRFDDAYRDGDLYVQMLHYPTFTSEEKLRRLRGLIDHAKSKGDVAFMTVGEFARKYERGRLERTETGWRVEESVDSGEPISDEASVTENGTSAGGHAHPPGGTDSTDRSRDVVSEGGPQVTIRARGEP
ncbi:DUF2334 domain-containing protein [Natrinema marinum]|uniref:DUF2334 domain-containing protein n=1 Tax=Natrinema marinum TaxID=2961598 RepID=UPI0020C8F631|nr:DUF2334 domain-containing protein [Natrinema marinum]